MQELHDAAWQKDEHPKKGKKSHLLLLQVSYLLQYGHLPSRSELKRWSEALMRHSALPSFVEEAVGALPHDAHFMGIILTALNALSTGHPEQNPALAGQDIYKSKEIQDKQIVRLIGMHLSCAG